MDRNQKIIGITNPQNIASQNLLKKLGLVYQGHYKKDQDLLSYFSLNSVD
jgi:RimJ/RimL family protein N-acetyltransferase